MGVCLMNKVVQMEEFLKNKDFNEQVLPFFNMLNTQYDFLLEDTEALFFMSYKENYLYVFLEYVPRNTFTDKPNAIDRFFNVKIDPRNSKGEWVVNKIYEIGNQYNTLLQELSSTFYAQTSLIQYLHEEIQK